MGAVLDPEFPVSAASRAQAASDQSRNFVGHSGARFITALELRRHRSQPAKSAVAGERCEVSMWEIPSHAPRYVSCFGHISCTANMAKTANQEWILSR